MGEIHGGSMLHVLPAGTYGLRPAVNRSNTRTWRATLRIPATGPLLTAARPLDPFCDPPDFLISTRLFRSSAFFSRFSFVLFFNVNIKLLVLCGGWRERDEDISLRSISAY